MRSIKTNYGLNAAVFVALAGLMFLGTGCQPTLEVEVTDPVVNVRNNGNGNSADINANAAGDGEAEEQFGEACDEDSECRADAICKNGLCEPDPCGAVTSCRDTGTVCVLPEGELNGFCACPEGTESRRMTPDERAQAGVEDNVNEHERCRPELPADPEPPVVECEEGEMFDAEAGICRPWACELACPEGELGEDADGNSVCLVTVRYEGCLIMDAEGNELELPLNYVEDTREGVDTRLEYCESGVGRKADLASPRAYGDIDARDVFSTDGELFARLLADPDVELRAGGPGPHGLFFESGQGAELVDGTSGFGDAFLIDITEQAVGGGGLSLITIDDGIRRLQVALVDGETALVLDDQGEILAEMAIGGAFGAEVVLGVVATRRGVALVTMNGPGRLVEAISTALVVEFAEMDRGYFVPGTAMTVGGPLPDVEYSPVRMGAISHYVLDEPELLERIEYDEPVEFCDWADELLIEEPAPEAPAPI